MNKGNKVFVIIVMLIVAASVWIILVSSSKPKPGHKLERADIERLVRGDSYRLGSGAAKVTIVEFGDYQCPACRAAEPLVRKILREHEQSASLVFRHLPIPGHLNALGAASAAEAAGEQGKYWDMHAKLYERQNEWSGSEKAIELFVGYAKELGLDAEKFATDQASKKYNSKIQRDVVDAEALQIRATPTFFINGIMVEGIPTSEFTGILNAELAKN